MNVQVDKQLTRLYAWYNARMRLTSCLSMQKLGLFHHLQFTEEKHDETVSILPIVGILAVAGIIALAGI